jgi:hypothetical protein
MCLIVTQRHNASEHRSFSTYDWTVLSQNTSFLIPPIVLNADTSIPGTHLQSPVVLHDNLQNLKNFRSSYFSRVIATTA